MKLEKTRKSKQALISQENHQESLRANPEALVSAKVNHKCNEPGELSQWILGIHQRTKDPSRTAYDGGSQPVGRDPKWGRGALLEGSRGEPKNFFFLNLLITYTGANLVGMHGFIKCPEPGFGGPAGKFRPEPDRISEAEAMVP